MKADAYPIEKIFDRNDKYFIPAYQRPYRWDPNDAEKLVTDIWDSCESNDDEYFIGSMICIGEDGNKYEVVDGQQRLITLTLILKQLSALATDGKLKNRLLERVLWDDEFSAGSESPVVEVRHREKEFYLSILNGKDVKPNTSTEKTFFNNKERIYTFLTKKPTEERNKLAEYLLKKVQIVRVVANDRQSSFRLFDVLNNRGMRLNDADLIKNFLLDEANKRGLSQRVEDKWLNLEELVGEKNLGGFFVLYVHARKTTRDRVIKLKNKRVSIFEYCQHLFRDAFDGDVIKILDDLNKSATHYDQILHGGINVGKYTSFLQDLAGGGRLKEWFPAVLAFLNKHGTGSDLTQFVQLLEKVYVQSCLRDVNAGERDAACYFALVAINGDKPFSEIMKATKERVDNEAFLNSLDGENFYDHSRRTNSSMVKSILIRVELERHDDSISKGKGKISLEHVLPRVMKDDYWKSRFSDEQHAQWCNKLGNLTLLSGSKNSAASNSGFDKKKEAYKKANQQSPFEITKEICELPEWGMEQLKNRHEALKEEITRLWLVE